MIISELIESLIEIQETEGDIKVGLPDGNMIGQVDVQEVVKVKEPLGEGNPERWAILSRSSA